MQTLMIIAYAGVAVAFILILLVMSMKNKGKICVRIKNPIKETEVWKKPETHGQRLIIVMEEPKGKKPGWSFDFTNESLIPKKAFMKTYFALDVFPGATHAIKWDYNLSTNDQPRLTRKEAREINFLEGFKARYRDLGRNQTSTLLLLLIFGNIAISVITLLIASGRLRI